MGSIWVIDGHIAVLGNARKYNKVPCGGKFAGNTTHNYRMTGFQFLDDIRCTDLLTGNPINTRYCRKNIPLLSFFCVEIIIIAVLLCNR